MINRKRLERTFLELTKINSPSFFEREAASYVKNFFASLGFQVEIDGIGKKIGGNSGNVIARLFWDKSLPTLLFNAHLDTVEMGKGIKVEIKRNVARSKTDTILGADDKAGVAALLELAKILKERDIKGANLVFLFTVAEEKGLLGAKNVDVRKIKADYGYVLDGADRARKIIVKAPSQNSIYAVFKGKEAHAGVCPEKGINAIQAASIAISKMRLGRIDEKTTANIGVIKGGVASNIVPERAEVSGEVRSFSEKKLAKETERITDCLKKGASALGAKVNIEVTRAYSTFSLGEKDEVVRIAMEAMRELKLKPELISSGGGSDANIFNEIGIPTVNLGVGAKDVHTKKEKLYFEELEKIVKVLLKIVEIAGRVKV